MIEKYTSANTLEHFLLMAAVGWLVGTLLTVLYFYSSVSRGDADVFWCFMIKVPLLVLITVSLAFTETGRCLLLLVPLQLCSSRGQMYIHGTVLLLVTTGPLMNLKHNLSVIQETSTCQQKGVADAAAEIADILFGPFTSFKQAAMEIVNGIKTMVAKIQAILTSFKRMVMTVADAIQGATRWINSKINGCKTTVGTTYQHCMDAFTWMYDECKVSVPSVFVKMCAVTEFASNLCSTVKPGEYLCDLVFFNVDPLVTTVSQRISRLLDRAYTLMYFSVNIHHEFHIDSNSQNIMSDIKERLKSSLVSLIIMHYFASVVQLAMFLFHFCFLWIVYRYRSRYLRRDEFDNYYMSGRLKDIDHLEALAGRESIFPLTRVETNKYIKVFSCKIVKKEWKSFSFPTFTTIKTGLYLGIIGMDYLLYFIAEKCRTFMLAVMQSFGSRTEVSIVGSGFLAELSRRVVRALNYMDYNFYQAHFMPCIPNPRPPNSWTNRVIYFWLIVLWFSWAMKPFVLRFRHVVMDYYNPDVADRRARWLYNHIVFKRMNFLKVVSIKLRGKYSSDQSKRTFSIADFLRAKYPWITYIIGKGLIGSYCKICNHVVPPLYYCPTKDCLGVYCDDCYISVQGLCYICRREMMVADFESKRINFKSITPDSEEIADVKDEEEGFFKVVDDESDLDFSYQDQMTSYRVSESEENSQTIQYTFVESNDDHVPFKSKLKHRKLREFNGSKKLSYEEMFEML
ncbi:DC-STAMP domain-containing protein 2-like [Macrosteles quadrilineatus]|uniref:DC-STAMP domain-containing protein 2-like n=1 Tax=Macrosteles quadrilineatus TaxID=74068 RepID=UPI0023E2F87B|nr:DC-STAMP domain-containing protein 2-like [Macrosteles quadrilineatus]